MTGAELIPVTRPAELLADLERSGALTPVSLQLPADVSFDRYEAVGALLGRVDSAAKWWIGDWLISGEAMFGEAAYQASEALGLAEDTRQRYALVAGKVPPPRRRAELSWTHHRHVAGLEPHDQDDWLASAQHNGWSARELFEQLRADRADEGPTVNASAMKAAALAIVRSAVQDGDHYRVPTDAFRALARALGEEAA